MAAHDEPPPAASQHLRSHIDNHDDHHQNKKPSFFSLSTDYTRPPAFLAFRSSRIFILTTVGLGIFSDMWLYGLVVSIFPYLLQDRVGQSPGELQSSTSILLAAYAVSSVLVSPVAGYLADRTPSRQAPYLAGLAAQAGATVLFFRGTTFEVLFLARVLQGASAAFVWTVGLALCVDTVGPRNLGASVGSIFSVCSVADLFAPVAGGALYNKVGLDAVAALAVGVLVVDFVARLGIVELKVARRYQRACPWLVDDAKKKQKKTVSNGEPSETDALLPPSERQQNGHANGNGTMTTTTTTTTTNNDAQNDAHAEDQEDDLPPLSDAEQRAHKLPQDMHPWLKKLPILATLRNASLLTALLIAFIQALLLGAFDSTIATHAKSLYNFDSLHASLLFLPMSIVNLTLGPLAGWLTDRFGSKPIAVGGFGLLAPALAALRFPGAGEPVVYAVLLATCGVGLAGIGPPSFVEASAVVDRYHRGNLDVFGAGGPYAQLYGLNSMVFSLGLTVGPLLAGTLVDAVGYGDMNAVMAGLAVGTCAVCAVWLGGLPQFLRGKRSE